MIRFKQLIGLLFTLNFIFIGCQSTEKDEDRIVADRIDEGPILFETIYNAAGNLESRQEMSDILELIGAAERTDKGIIFQHVELTTDGYTGYIQTCPEANNGTLTFLIGNNPGELSAFYDNYEPLIEHQGQDLFIYAIRELFVNPTEKVISLKIDEISLNPANGIYGIAVAIEPAVIEIWQDFEFGTVMKYNNNYYLKQELTINLPKQECFE